MTTAELETPQTPTGPGFSDAVTFAFASEDGTRCGVARAGLSPAPNGSGPQASGLGVLFLGSETVAVRAAGGLDLGTASTGGVARDWAEAGGVSAETLNPLQRWRVSFASDDEQSGFTLAFEAAGPPARLASDSPVAQAGGMEGYEQLCRVVGTVRVHGEEQAIHGLGSRGHSWGEPNWDRIQLARTVQAWLGDDLGVSLTSVRPSSAKTHGDEAVDGVVFDTGPEGTEALPILMGEPRFSTTSDERGRQRTISVELLEREDAYARRAAGRVICGTTLDLGRLQLDCSFVRWSMEGRTGLGRYDVLRRA